MLKAVVAVDVTVSPVRNRRIENAGHTAVVAIRPSAVSTAIRPLVGCQLKKLPVVSWLAAGDCYATLLVRIVAIVRWPYGFAETVLKKEVEIVERSSCSSFVGLSDCRRSLGSPSVRSGWSCRRHAAAVAGGSWVVGPSSGYTQLSVTVPQMPAAVVSEQLRHTCRFATTKPSLQAAGNQTGACLLIS
jgi:hypothetical protein